MKVWLQFFSPYNYNLNILILVIVDFSYVVFITFSFKIIYNISACVPLTLIFHNFHYRYIYELSAAKFHILSLVKSDSCILLSLTSS